MARGARKSLIGRKVSVRHGFLWLRTGQGIIRATYEKQGRTFVTVELIGSGKVLPRLLSQLRDVESEAG